MKKLQKGFTLIELMIVVAIIAILAAIAVPQFGLQIKKSKDAKALGNVGSFRSASVLYYSDNEKYAADPVTVATLLDKNALQNVYSSSAGAAYSTGATMFYEVGTSGVVFSGGTPDTNPYISTNYTTSDGAFTITGAAFGKDTKKIDWVTY